MKKALLILLAFALVFGLVFTGCPNGSTKGPGQEQQGGPGDGDGDLIDVVIFNLQDPTDTKVTHGIQALPVGPLTFPSTGDGPLAPIARAAGDEHADYEIITVDGKKALKYVTHATWGPGFDLPNKAFGFRAEDKITIIGSATGANIDLALNVNQNFTQKIIGERITETGPFTIEVELTAADVADITGSNNEQKVIRFEDRASTDTTVTITQILIEGKRPSNIKKLDTPVVTVTATGVEWTAVEGASGYKVFVDDDEDPIAKLTTETSINLKMLDALDPGTYSITVVALGTTGSTSDSDKSTPVSYTKPEPVVLVLEFGAGKTVLTNVGGGTFEYLPDGTGYTFTYPASGENVGYGNSYVSFAVDLGAGSKFSDFSAVKATFVGVAGDIGWKHVFLFASATALNAAIASSDGAIGDHNAVAANTTAAVATFDISENDIDNQTVYLAIIFWAGNTGDGGTTSYTISNVTLIE
jgi:hypothetical protein